MDAVWQPRAFEQRCACLAALGRAAELESLLDRSPGPRVRYYLALAYARSGAIDQAAEERWLALTGNPDSRELRELAWRMEPARAIARVEAGDRRAAAEIWERELAAHPDNFAVLQNLAILYHYWAREQEAAGGAEADRLWMAAISYWTRIATSDAFWSAWRAELARRWGMEVFDSDLQPVRDTLLEEKLMRVFEGYWASYKERGRAADAERHDDYLTDALLARRPAPFASDGLSKILVLIEERAAPEKALERLAALPESERTGPDAARLRVRALLESARALQSKRLSWEALRRIETAWVGAQAVHAFQEETGMLLDSIARQEAARLQQEDRADEAIDLLERLYELSKRPALREYACIFCCERGDQKLRDKNFDQARGQFQRALRFDASYTRARRAIAAAYRSEGLTAMDAEAKLKLLQKAVEYNPNDRTAREDLGVAFHEKALRIVREANASNAKLELARAIGLFRAAALALNPDLSEQTLDAIVRSADPGSDEIRKLPEGLYRTTLENAASVARHRKQVRSE